MNRLFHRYASIEKKKDTFVEKRPNLLFGMVTAFSSSITFPLVKRVRDHIPWMPRLSRGENRYLVVNEG